MQIPINQIFPNPDQPRTVFNQADIEALAQSIKFSGLVQPVTVEDTGSGYILVDGERRWRAYRLLGLEKIEASVRPSSNHNGRDRLIGALVANIQRANMGAVDEARAYKKLADELGSADAVAEVVGVSVSTIFNRLLLLDMEVPIQEMYNVGRLPFDAPSIRALLHLSPEERLHVAMTAATRGASGRIIKKMCAHAERRAGIDHRHGPKPIRVRETHTGHFDALALVSNQVPVNLVNVVTDTCKSCPLYDMASVTTCRECPLVSFLRILVAQDK